MKLSEYIESRFRVISSSIAAEQLAGNEFKLGCERAAEAELRGLEAFLSSADYTMEPAAQPPTQAKSKPAEIAESIKAACFPCEGEYIVPRKEWLIEWVRQLLLA